MCIFRRKGKKTENKPTRVISLKVARSKYPSTGILLEGKWIGGKFYTKEELAAAARNKQFRDFHNASMKRHRDFVQQQQRKMWDW